MSSCEGNTIIGIYLYWYVILVSWGYSIELEGGGPGNTVSSYWYHIIVTIIVNEHVYVIAMFIQ